MPQPMSTPTVAGITASFVATTDPTAALAQVRVGHQRDVLEQAGQTRNIAQHVLFFEAERVIGPRQDFAVSSGELQLFIRHGCTSFL